MSEKLRHVNAVLLKLSQDEDLHDDFKLPTVQAAINHWTNRKRLDAEKAQQLQNDRRVVYVLQRFQMLQSVCQQAGMPVPLDHLLTRKTEVDPSIVKQYFKDEPSKINQSKRTEETEIKTEEDKKAKPVAVEEKSEIIEPEAVSTTEPVQKSDASIQSQDAVSAANTPSPVVSASAAGGLNVNAVLKFFIALTFVMIAVVLAQLWK